MSTNIHKTAIISNSAKIAPNVQIGPYSVVGENVELSDGVVIANHVSIEGNTFIGENSSVAPFAVIGGSGPRQNPKGDGVVVIGKNTDIREHVTIHKGVPEFNMKTIVGDNCLLMVASHVAHDCVIGDNVILSNNATLGGHVIVGEHAVIGGLAAIHQFVKIGKHAMIGGMSPVSDDVLPYSTVHGERATMRGINIRGLKRRGFDNASISKIIDTFNYLFNSSNSTLNEKVLEIRNNPKNTDVVNDILDFILDPSRTRGIINWSPDE